MESYLTDDIKELLLNMIEVNSVTNNDLDEFILKYCKDIFYSDAVRIVAGVHITYIPGLNGERLKRELRCFVDDMTGWDLLGFNNLAFLQNAVDVNQIYMDILKADSKESLKKKYHLPDIPVVIIYGRKKAIKVRQIWAYGRKPDGYLRLVFFTSVDPNLRVAYYEIKIDPLEINQNKLAGLYLKSIINGFHSANDNEVVL